MKEEGAKRHAISAFEIFGDGGKMNSYSDPLDSVGRLWGEPGNQISRSFVGRFDRRARARTLFGAAATVLLLSLGLWGAPSGAATSQIHRGGTLTYATPVPGSLDPDSPLFGSLQTCGAAIYGQLFYEYTAGMQVDRANPISPGLALSYAYSDGLKTLTLQLRHGVKFQDGTPFNAAAVVWNLERAKTTANESTPFLTDVTSVDQKGKYTVIIHLSQPDSNLVNTFATYSVGLMASPTAYNSEGATQFGLAPIGAGAFKVTSFTPSETVDTTSWSGYWDKSQEYLSGLDFNGNAYTAGDLVEEQDLLSGAIDGFYDGVAGTVSVIQTLTTNKSITTVKELYLSPNLLVLNTVKPPFNNQLAREAVDYCLDRPALAQSIFDNYSKPAYVLSAPDESYFPPNGLKPPKGFYNYNPSMGEAIVKQLGGISFSFIVSPTPGTTLTYEEAMAAGFQSCGMQVTETPESLTQLAALRAAGSYQMYFTANGGTFAPYPIVAPYALPSSSEDVDNVNVPTVTNLLTATGYTTNNTALTGLWTRIYDVMDTYAVDIPVTYTHLWYWSLPTVHGLEFNGAWTLFEHAWLSS
jgi:peptide/nickel transport system substrate-binding protein